MKWNGMAKTGKNSPSAWVTCAKIGIQIVKKEIKLSDKLNTQSFLAPVTLTYCTNKKVVKKEIKQ